jgi:predicted nucleotidyltransferase
MNEGLAQQAKRAIALFERAARLSYGDEIVMLVLFGSHARGEAHAASDVDIAVVLKDIPDRSAARNKLADIAYEAIVETYIDVQALPVSLEEWEHPEHYRNTARGATQNQVLSPHFGFSVPADFGVWQHGWQQSANLVMKQQFTLDSFAEVKRCEEFYRRGKPLAVLGKDVLTGESKVYTGRVLSIESVSGRPTRVTMEVAE